MNEHIRFDRDALELHLLDQRLLPEEEADFACRTPGEVITALQTMVVRGAPAIGVTAAWGCALAAAAGDESEGWQERLTAALAEETPVERLGEPDEIARTMVFLADEASGYITGQVLGVNGGLVI